jgi:small GTP-binding protein
MANKLFLFGLDRAGKTALSRALRGDIANCTSTRPTLAFDISKMMIQQTEFVIWDAPGQTRFRDIWESGFNQAKLLLFVLDVSDTARFEEAKKEFDRVINNPETKGVPLMFCFHKVDLPNGKENILKAREIFKLPLITNRRVASFETTINPCDEIPHLRDILVDMINQSRW